MNQCLLVVVNMTPDCAESVRLTSPRIDGNEMSSSDEPCRICGPNALIMTVMIQHVPTIYTREAMLIELRGIVGDGFDFFYMPQCEFSSENRGYAIVNFIQPLDAMNCIAALSGRKCAFVSGNNKHAYEVVPAKCQGIAANLEMSFYELGSFPLPGKEESAPLVIKDGKPITFEEAVKEYCPEKYDIWKTLSGKGRVQVTPMTTDESCNEEDDGSDCTSQQGSDDGSESLYSDSGEGSSQEDFSGCDPRVIDSFRARFGPVPTSWEDLKR